MFGSITYLLGLVGMTGIKAYLQLGLIGGGVIAINALKFMDAQEEQELEKMNKNNREIDIKLKALQNETIDFQAVAEQFRIEKEHAKVMLNQKEKVVEAAHMVTIKPNENIVYKGIKAPNMKSLLLGYRADGSPVWGTEVNYIIAGTTQQGKTRKMHVVLLNYLANRQGDVYIVDLKGTDYPMYEGIEAVKCRVSELKHVPEAVKAFKAEYERRKVIFNEGYTDKKGIHRTYLNVDDYNDRNPKNKLKQFMLFIDEFADISDSMTVREKPIGSYEEIIEMARKCGALGGRVFMGTQRPSKDVIIGVLKNNCNLIGLACLNEINSKIVLDVPGCEDLKKTEALAYVDKELTKIFAYNIENQNLLNCTDALKGIKIYDPMNKAHEEERAKDIAEGKAQYWK